MNTKTATIIVLLCCTSTLCVAADAYYVNGLSQVPQRMCTVFSVNEPPVIDGKLDDGYWQALPETSDFTCVITRSGLAEAQTFVKIGMTQKDLVVAFRCVEPKMDMVLKEVKIKDDFRESVEIFIDTNLDHSTYSQFRVSNGGLYEANTGYGQAYEGDLTGLKVAVGFEKDAWVVEIAIAFSLIGDTPTTGDCWGLNLNRQRSVVEPIALSCWSNTGGGFHMPDKFGQVIFGSFDNWMMKYIENIKTIDVELKTMIKTYPKSLANSDDLIKQLPQTESGICLRTVTERDKLKAMERVFDIEEKYRKILSDARLVVIEGEFE